MALTIADIKKAISSAIKDEIKPLVDESIKNAIKDQIKTLVDESIKSAIKDQIMPILNAIEIKERNSHAGRDEPLEWPPLKEKGPYALEEPISVNCLLVAGNEMLPKSAMI